MVSISRIIHSVIFIGILSHSLFVVDATLKLINVVFRHGDRTPSPPLELYPKDPYLHHNFDPPGYGMLTKTGESRTMDLGKLLRRTYNDFLGTNYIRGSVEARSTDINRTKESLELVLKALYPAVSIPTTFKSILQDSLLFPQICPGYLIEYMKVLGKADITQEMRNLKGFMQKLSKWTGKNIRSALDMYLIYTTLEAEKFMNFTLPSWTEGADDLLKASTLELKIMNYNELMKRQNGGMLIKKLTEDMKSIKNGSMDKKRKIILYSAHDITVSSVLSALNVYYPHVPKFSSAVIVELHLINQIFYVKISYYLGVPAEIKKLTIPGCQILCPLNQFIKLVRNVTPSGFDLLCSKICIIENMHSSRRRTNSEREINAIIDRILKKGRCRNRYTKRSCRNTKNVNQSGYETCQGAGNEGVNNGIESSVRFSLRVMEAMRSLQRSNENQSLTSSSMEEIVNYIGTNYHFDGDLDAQVRTALSRISRQGFILSLGEKNYHLIGPFATYMNKYTRTSDRSRPCVRKKRSSSSKSQHDERGSRHRKCGRGRPKRGRKEGQQDGCPAKSKKRRPSRTCKSEKRKKCSLKQQCGREFPGENIQFNEDYQSGNSSSSYVTCYQDFSPENVRNEKKLYKNGIHFCGGSGPSRGMSENIAPNSEDESSVDSIYQKLSVPNSRTVGDNNKELKKWIKNCRRGCNG